MEPRIMPARSGRNHPGSLADAAIETLPSTTYVVAMAQTLVQVCSNKEEGIRYLGIPVDSGNPKGARANRKPPECSVTAVVAGAGEFECMS